MGWYAFVVFSVAALAQLVVGYLLDAYSLRIVFAVVAITQASFFIIMKHLSGIASLLVAIGFMLAVFGQIPINDVLVGRPWLQRAVQAAGRGGITDLPGRDAAAQRGLGATAQRCP